MSPDHLDPDRINFALVALHELCLSLAAEGCGPIEQATALAHMLGTVTAAIACCPEHAEQAEETVLEIFEESLATQRVRFAAFERVGEAGMPSQEGHA